MKKMNFKIKEISEAEFEAWKERDFNNSLNKNFNYSFKRRENYYSNNRKKIQRILNYYVRAINKNIEQDYLWRGRFFVRQVGHANFYRFFDGSGAQLNVTLRFYDKKKMCYVDKHGSVSAFCGLGRGIFWDMNDIIVKTFDAWGDNPKADRIDYNSIPNDYVAENAKYIYAEEKNE